VGVDEDEPDIASGEAVGVRMVLQPNTNARTFGARYLIRREK
jgi:hypothetical protein